MIVQLQQIPQQYSLSLPTLLGVLQAHAQNCVLWTHIDDDTLTQRSPLAPLMPSVLPVPLDGQQTTKVCQGELIIIEGHVTRSLIRELTQGQVVMEGHPALTLLSHYPTLTWIVRPHDRASSSSSLHDDISTGTTEPLEAEMHDASTRWLRHAPPHLIKPLCREAMEVLPHRQRQVLLLIYGARDVPTICRVLHTTLHHLLPILDTLAELGWIE